MFGFPSLFKITTIVGKSKVVFGNDINNFWCWGYTLLVFMILRF